MINSGELNADYLTSIAEDIGLDVEDFHEHLADVSTGEALVQEDFAEGQAIAVTGACVELVGKEWDTDSGVRSEGCNSVISQYPDMKLVQKEAAN